MMGADGKMCQQKKSGGQGSCWLKEVLVQNTLFALDHLGQFVVIFLLTTMASTSGIPSSPLSVLAPTTPTSAEHPVRGHKPSTASSLSPLSPSTGGQPHVPTTPLTTLYLVSGLPKSPHTWTLADTDSVAGLHHAEGAVGRWWRAEVLGSSVSPGVGRSRKKSRKSKETDTNVIPDGPKSTRGSGALSKTDLGRMLSKALKLSFPREVEIIAATLQPASTTHTFTFQVPAGASPGVAQSHTAQTAHLPGLRTSVMSSSTSATYNHPYVDPTLPRPSSTYLGPPSSTHLPPSTSPTASTDPSADRGLVTYHGVCLTVWSHADEERSLAIRRALESVARSRRGSGTSTNTATPATPRRPKGTNGSGPTAPWSDAEESEADAFSMSESDADIMNPNGVGMGASNLFLPQNTVFWLPYALTLVSRHPIYDLMRDYLTLSWARFSKDVQSHTLQISKILEFPAPRAGDVIKLDASPANEAESLEVVCRFPGGLDFGKGLVDVNFTMWPLFRCLNIDNILTICEIALSPTGRVLFLSRHPTMLGIAVSTIRYLVEMRGWSGIALPMVHARDAKIYIEDPGPWLMGLSTEARYISRTAPEVCIVDLDINYVNCASPPPGAVSTKQQRDKLRKILLGAFDQFYHPDNAIPPEFKEAFPAGRFRPLCKIQTKRGSSTAVVAESIKAPEWWHQTKVLQAFDTVLKDRARKPSLLKRLTLMGMGRRQAQLSAAEQLIQRSIRKRATAFVDARDDLETKIGRLSRRLNFLMSESELWREKFVAFEGYAEKLSAEAAELRQKIGKEQRESRRLSGLVNVSAQEKEKLANMLANKETQHQAALVELESMRQNMDEMERERAQMVAEVEAQIERALASMAFSDGDNYSDYTHSRPGSAMSQVSQGSRIGGHSAIGAGGASIGGLSGIDARSLRHSGSGPGLRQAASRSASGSISMQSASESFEGGSIRRLRSVATVTTLADDASDEVTRVGVDLSAQVKAELGDPIKPTVILDDDILHVRRFSVEQNGVNTMGAVDLGITERSDVVALKVQQIQQKLENALADHRCRRSQSITSGSASEADSMQRVLSEAESTGRRGLSEAESTSSSNRRTRTPRGTSRLAGRHRSRSSASLRAAREALMAVKDAVPPVPRNGSVTSSPAGIKISNRLPSSAEKSPTGTEGKSIRKATSRVGMTTPESSSSESSHKLPILTVEPAPVSKPTLNLPDFEKYSRDDMLPTPTTPGRNVADDSDDSYLSAVDESVRDDESWSKASGRRALDDPSLREPVKAATRSRRPRLSSTSTARGLHGDLPSPTISESTAVGSARGV
ncbi:DENN (AEX-3) domain protein [Rhizoctonia solani 123E]|uniref:DENN (AEX-3) domain protein n=1 Tax=Rhizoctonia solani 123E TaxID=1423351 RepID=A0A074SE59_9AGAM|nr:DENN (AEX-3) domain protein [Rhizoctonia solani 123E]